MTKSTVVALAPLAVLLACASAPPPRTSEPRDDCVYTRDINTISALDDRHVWVKASANRSYLFTVDKTCQDLAIARKISFFEATVRVCGDGNSLITFTNPTRDLIRCRVERVQTVRDKDAAKALISVEEPVVVKPEE